MTIATSFVRISTFCFAVMSMQTLTIGEQIVFTEGDASFVTLVAADSTFFTDELAIRANAGFGCYVIPDIKSAMLSLRNVPSVQVESAREKARDLIDGDSVNAHVIMAICDAKFDFATTWLGVPYNPKKFRLSNKLTPSELAANCFGPRGAATLASKDAEFVPSLPVVAMSDTLFEISGDVSIAFFTFDHAFLQGERHVIDRDGSRRTVRFDFKPEYRVGFEEGDAFFVAKAASLLSAPQGPVELDYYVHRRFNRNGVFAKGSREMKISAREEEYAALELPLHAHGSRLLIENIPRKLQIKLNQLLPEIPRTSVWYVFVTDINYNAVQHDVGKRYNRIPFEMKMRPVNFEYEDCTSCVESHPVGLPDDPWPPSLRVTWKDDLAVCDMKTLKLVIAENLDRFELSSNPERAEYHFQVTQNAIQKWSWGKLIEEHSID